MITNLEHWKQVRRLEQDWQQLENVDRGYNFKAASRARDEFKYAEQFYRLWWGEEWNLDDEPKI